MNEVGPRCCIRTPSLGAVGLNLIEMFLNRSLNTFAADHTLACETCSRDHLQRKYHAERAWRGRPATAGFPKRQNPKRNSFFQLVELIIHLKPIDYTGCAVSILIIPFGG